jgi:hypothetical protein
MTLTVEPFAALIMQIRSGAAPAESAPADPAETEEAGDLTVVGS